MRTKTTNIILGILMIGSFLAGLWAYPTFPPQIATHWDISGQVNGYMGRIGGVFLIPGMLAVFVLLFVFIPVIDPLRKNIAEFRKQYNAMMLAVAVFFVIVYALILGWNMGFRFPMQTVIAEMIGILMLFIGTLLPKMKRNWFLGIRTPWTLSSDIVWEKTHRQGGRIFSGAGVLMIVAGLFMQNALMPIVAIIIAASVWLVVYSYLTYHKEMAHLTGKKKR